MKKHTEEETMLEIGNTIISLDIIEKKFVCDVKSCKGVCCVAGDSGAPLEEEEAIIINELTPNILHRLTPDAQQVIAEQGTSMIDIEGDLVTTILSNSGSCVFTLHNKNGIAYCAIEEAWAHGETDFRKPISCHLYPIRITKYSTFDALNFHAWEICEKAIIKGEITGVPVYKFTKDALIRKYGHEWYEQLEWAAENLDIKK